MPSKTSPKDLAFVSFYVLLGFVLLALVVTGSGNSAVSQAVSIYTNLYYFSIALLVLGLILGPDNKYFGFLIFGEDDGKNINESRLILSIVIGAVLGFLIVTQLFSLFSISFIPAQLQSLATNATSNGTFLFITLIGPISETLLFFGILVPTFKKFIMNLGLPFMFLFFGIVIGFLTGYYAIMAIMIILAVAFFLIPSLKHIVVANLALVTFIAISFASVAFGIYHVRAYSSLSSPETAILGAILFGYLSAYLAEFSGNIIGAIMLHIVANVVIYLQDYNVSWTLGAIVIIAYVALVLFAYQFSKRFKFTTQKVFTFSATKGT